MTVWLLCFDTVSGKYSACCYSNPLPLKDNTYIHCQRLLQHSLEGQQVYVTLGKHLEPSIRRRHKGMKHTVKEKDEDREWCLCYMSHIAVTTLNVTACHCSQVLLWPSQKKTHEVTPQKKVIHSLIYWIVTIFILIQCPYVKRVYLLCVYDH